MTRVRILTTVIAIGALIAVTQTLYARAATSAAPVAQQQDQGAHQAHHPPGNTGPVTQAQEAQMMDMHQKIMADMKAMDATLDGLVTKMNAAQGDAKVEAIAELLTAVVQQRTTMRDAMMQMQPKMMGHMMEHMAAGVLPGTKKMMAECPMMKRVEAAR